MKRLTHYFFASIVFVACFAFVCTSGSADDTCVFSVTADDVAPNIVILLDNGAEMKQVAWHSSYDNSVDYTPRDGVDNDGDGEIDEADEIDEDTDDEVDSWRKEVSSINVADGGNGFFHENGYAICSGNSLVPIDDDLLVATGDCNNANNDKIVADSTLSHNDDTDFATFSIYKGNGVDDDGVNGIDDKNEIGETFTTLARTIKLAAEANSTVFKAEHGFPPGDIGEIIDGAGYLRYSKNYLNWLFFSTGAGSYVDESAVDDGTDLPKVSRFYYAKKAILTTARLTSNKANFALFNFANDDGGSNVQPIGPVVDTIDTANPSNNVLDPNFINAINSMGTVDYSPLAEGLQSVGYYYSSSAISQYVDYEYCQKHFALVVTPGVSSQDEGSTSSHVPESPLSDLDDDGSAADLDEGEIKEDSTKYTIPTNLGGTAYLDDVAHYLYTNKVVGDTSNDSVWNGTSNVLTYTVGFMGGKESNLFLMNTSNNGNGETNLYDTSHLDYGKWHYEAEDPDDLSEELLAAVNDILSQTSSFTAPVVPVTRTTSGNYIYMAFFTPGDTNFWQGNVTKYGIYSDGATIKIVDKNGNDATYANGAMKEGAEPYWEIKDWSTPGEDNYVLYSNRNIYTYPTTSASTTLTHTSNAFNSTNITAAMLGNPTAVTVNGNAVSGVDKVINYVRGADVFDEDGDGNTIGAAAGDTAENRAVITGDVLHSEPLVVYYNSSTIMVYFGGNDGMLHAVKDSDDPTDADYGEEKWAFIPRDQLSGLKNIIEGSTHQYYVDASPKAYIKDTDENGEIEPAKGDKVYLICGEREGGTGYFMLNVTDPDAPVYMGAVTQAEIPELGETWSEPQFGLVKTSDADTDGTAVFFVGGGYSADNSLGCAVAVVDIEDPTDTAGSGIGGVLVFKNGHTPSAAGYGETIANMDYSIASPVTVLDIDSNHFVDVVYVGDLGGQMWRLGRFHDQGGTSLTFPTGNENIKTWTAQRIFVAPTYTVDATTYSRKFFYPPAVTFEKGYHLVFAGTGDRESPCSLTSEDRIYCIKDTHETDPEFDEDDLVDVTDPAATAPSLSSTLDVDSNRFVDQGWYIQLATGEKVLGEGTVFYRTLYITTFIPNLALDADADPCMPGGLGKLYALNYLTGGAILDFDGDDDTERTVSIGGGIPSKPVMVITGTGQKLFISVGSTNPDDSVQGEGFGAGIVAVDPLAPPANFFLLWWRELFS